MIKDSLTQDEKFYVGEKEAIGEGCLKSIEIARLLDIYQAIRLEEKGKVKPKSEYKPDYRKGSANEPNRQYKSGYASGKDVDTKSGGAKNGSCNALKPKSMAQVVMKDDRPNTNFRNNPTHKSSTYRARKVKKQDDKVSSSEEMDSEGAEEQEEGQKEKQAMRVGIESRLIKKLHTENITKDREGEPASEKN